ncbi:MAG: hypothetical protein V9G25_01740 [Acidimicrobiia bacterium]
MGEIPEHLLKRAAERKAALAAAAGVTPTQVMPHRLRSQTLARLTQLQAQIIHHQRLPRLQLKNQRLYLLVLLQKFLQLY